MNRRELLRILISEFEKLSITDSVAEARHALSWVEGCSLMETIFDVPARQDAFDKAQEIINRRAKKEPLAYIIGERYFMGLRFEVCPDVLIPRQDTELLCENAIELINSSGIKTVLDVCTGSGAIAVSIAHYTQARVSASDISQNALKVAMKNATDNEVNVGFVLSDLFENIEGRFDMITANPPYICTADYNVLSPDVHDYEPELALHAMGDGLCFYKDIAKDAKKHLSNGGWLFLEIGHDQGQGVTNLLKEDGYSQVTCSKDIPGKDRLICAKYIGHN